MKRNTRNALLLTLSVFAAVNCLPALAAGTGKANYVPPNTPPRVSDRLIVKLRPNYLSKGLSVAQINAEMNRPLAAQTISQMQAAAGANLAEIRALSNGAHVLSIPGTPNRQAMDRAIAGIGRLADVEYVEEDRIMTAQVAPPVNDTYYLTYPAPVGNPGLWGMWPVSAVPSLPAPGGTGSYGADFETAWGLPLSATGTGKIVAVVDTGITPHVDIVGPPSNLFSLGYTFISDCRVRGSTAPGGCVATTATGPTTSYIAPSADATDWGDFISSADSTTVGSYFYGQPVSNSSWHGTHVAGTIAAIGKNLTGVIGGAYGAKILPVRVLGKGGGYLSDITDGVRWAAGVHPTIANLNPANVINLSLGGTGPCSVTEQATINAVVLAGAVVVVAAGNDGQDVANASPANCNNVISVAAIARDGSRATYSNFSSPASNFTNPAYVTLAAPGGDQGSYPATFDPGILSTINAASQVPDTTITGTSGPNSYAYYQGTSMATPHVAAAVALMMAVPNTPALTPTQIKNILSAADSLRAFPSFSVFPAWDCATSKNCGAGILDANKAVQNSATPLTATPTTVDFGTLATNITVSRTVTLTNNNTAGNLILGTATITGANATLFTIASNTCDLATIAPAGSCQITMNYTPTSAGSHSATLSVPTTAPVGAIGIGLTGIRGPAALTTATPTVTATTVTVGQSTTVDLSFTNPNAIQVTLGTVTLSKPAIMALSLDSCSSAILAAVATCNVTVTITPNAVGAYSGTVTASLASGGSSTQATISGTANPVPSGGGGGCSVMPAGANPDPSLPLALLVVLAYWLRRRVIRTRDAA